MNRKKRKTLLLVGLLVAGILGAGYWGISAWQENEKEHAVSKTKQYMKEHYPDRNYELRAVDVSHGWWNDFKFYGYYAYEVMVEDIDTGDSFFVYYDRNMKYMDDSKHMEAQEKWCSELEPLIEQYLTERFGKHQTSQIWYDLETKNPYVHVEFEETIPFMTETEWDAFQTFLKTELGIKSGEMNVLYGYTEQYYEAKW